MTGGHLPHAPISRGGWHGLVAVAGSASPATRAGLVNTIAVHTQHDVFDQVDAALATIKVHFPVPFPPFRSRIVQHGSS
jgi:hypothetical protein